MERSEKIHRLVATRSIIFSYHTRTRMFERGISSENVFPTLTKGEIIETYEDDTPCPLYLDTFTILQYILFFQYVKIILKSSPYHPDDRWTHHKLRR